MAIRDAKPLATSDIVAPSILGPSHGAPIQGMAWRAWPGHATKHAWPLAIQRPHPHGRASGPSLDGAGKDEAAHETRLLHDTEPNHRSAGQSMQRLGPTCLGGTRQERAGPERYRDTHTLLV